MRKHNIRCIVYLCISWLHISKAYLRLEWDGANPVFDPTLYMNALNPDECSKQLEYISRTDNLPLRLQFIESGLRVPRSIQSGNTMDWGNYFQCLGITEEVEDMEIQGKYCTINVPAGQIINTEIPELTMFNPNYLTMNNYTRNQLKTSRAIDDEVQALTRRIRQGLNFEQGKTGVENLQNIDFTLALCIPKPCTSEEGLNGILFNLTSVGFQYQENFCRIKNDKPWAPIDFVTIAIFSTILLLTLLSTSYDLWHKYTQKADPKAVNKVFQSFSVYTNTRRLLTFNSSPGALECVDGIRAISIIWIILGHTFSTLPARVNVLDAVNWVLSFGSIWITSAPISVDTFFMLSGLLLVYTTAGKMTGKKLLKNLHLFYLNRLLRMFPLLAAAILLQASILFRIADGPMWNTVATMTNDCRIYWWSTLLYVQNYANTNYMCVPHTWYLAIDMQLHIISPLILFWVLSDNKKIAWTALASSLLIVLISATVYNFIKEFPSSSLQPSRADESLYYTQFYYVNTLPRAPPFFVGMVFGYVLHLWRGEKVKLSKPLIIILWMTTFVLTSLVIYSSYPPKSMDWDNQILDSLINSFIRPVWALALGWIIFACTHGYGGPINWLLSLYMWKLPSRLSYGMYLFHYCTMMVTSGTALAPIFFTTLSTLYRFLSEFSIAMLLSFIMTLLIDSPFSTLIKLVLSPRPKK